MHIGVDATSWHNNRGYGRHARALLTSLVRRDAGNRYTLFLDSREGADGLPERCKPVFLDSGTPTAVAASAAGRRSASDMWRVSRALSASQCDVLLFPTIYSYVPTFSRARKLVMIHDVIAETFPSLTLPRASARLFWNLKVALGRWQADALITVSDYSRAGIVRHFGADPSRVFVVGEASDPVFRVLPDPRPTPKLESLGVERGRRFVCYVGGFSPHKNLEALVRAFAGLADRPEFADVSLVMVGEYAKEVFHSYYDVVSALVDQLGIRDRVIFTGFLPDAELVALLNLASVLALPSLMEGFGLPAIEAAACGCPVIATNASPLAALLGAGGVFIEPSQEALRGALELVLGSAALRERMGKAGVDAARRLTWDAAAAQMMDVIEKVAAQ